MATKVCSKCGRERDLIEFPKRKLNRDGLDGWCRECWREYKKQYRRDNSDKIKEQSRGTHERHGEKYNATAREKRRQRAIAEGRTINDGVNHRKRVLKQETLYRKKVRARSGSIDRVSGIYMIRSISKSDRFYVGSSIDVHQRWSEHKSSLARGYHSSSKLQNHYNKYGEDDLSYVLLETCEDWELLLREQYYLDNFKPFFNNSKIAGSRLGMRFSRKSKKKMSDSQRGRKASPETRAKQSAAHKGKPKSAEWRKKIGDSNRGKKLSKATKRKLSAARLGRKLNLTPEERTRRQERGRSLGVNRHKKAS